MKGFFDLIQNYQKEILGISVLAIALSGGVYYYRYSRLHREEQAHAALSETLYEFNKALRDQTTWKEVSLAAYTGYRQHKNASLAPYFLSIQAEAACHTGDMDEAKKIMDTVLHEIPTSSALYYPLKLKYARMRIDSEDENVSQQGLQELGDLAHESSGNAVEDAALYYLGSYYAARNDMVRAKQEWNALVAKFAAKKEDEVSPWVELAQAHLR